MRDYKETSAILRGLSVSLQAIDHDYAQLCDDAADVIEELDVIVEGYRSRMRLGSQWISVEERLPKNPYGCLLVVWDSPQNGGDDFLNYLPYFAGWDGEQWNDEDGMQVPFEVAYWMPLPEAPKEETP